jgi:hypothetical protein
MNLILPEETVAKEGIAKKINIGTMLDKIVNIITLKEGDLLLTEMSDEDYEILGPIFKKYGVEYKIVVNIPEIVTPKSFLFEEDIDRVVSFDMLELKEKSDSEKIFDEMIENTKRDNNHGGSSGEDLDQNDEF